MNILTYTDARETINDGDVVFLCGKWSRPIEALIMFFTGSRFFHASIAFWVGTGNSRRCLLVEAHGRSPRRIILLSFYQHHNMVVIPGPKPWGEVQDHALARVAVEGYGIFEAAYIGLREFLLKNLNIHLPTYDFPQEVCSEFVARTYGISPPNISPQVLFEGLTNQTKTEA